MIEMRELMSLRALANGGSFEAAARALNITPGAMSQRIKQIEDRLGQIVVVRASPARLTHAGEALLRLAQQVDILVHDAIHSLTGETAAPSLTVAVNHDSLATWFMTAMARFTEVSSATVEVRCVDQHQTSSLLRDGSAVAAVSAEPKPPQGCDAISLGGLEYAAVCSPQFARKWLAPSDNPGARDTCPMVMFEQSDALSRRIAEQMTPVMGTPRVHYLPDANAMLRAAIDGIGWAVVPALLAGGTLADGKLVAVPSGNQRVPQLVVPLYLHHWRLGGRTLGHLIDCVRQTAAATLQGNRRAKRLT